MRAEELLRRAGLPASPCRPLGGGMMGRVVRCGGLVVKTYPSPSPGLLEAEARGLAQLAAAGARVPKMYYTGPGGLVMAYLEPGPPAWPDLARQLAGLHTAPGSRYGNEAAVFLGSFPLPTSHGGSWRRFFAEQRIRPLLEAVYSRLGPLGPRVARLMEHYAPPVEGPVLLHGDLWNGNVYMTRDGAALLDPSVWWGERGVDLAMMMLFGGFPEQFWQVYQALLPVPDEVWRALPYYQAYYLLAHVHFFGSGYLWQLERSLAALSA